MGHKFPKITKSSKIKLGELDYDIGFGLRGLQCQFLAILTRRTYKIYNLSMSGQLHIK